MKVALHNRILVLLVGTLLGFFHSEAQQQKPFEQVPENVFTIKGNLDLVGNNIVSIAQSFGNVSYAPEDNFNEFANNANLRMEYIDIDNDPSTISSSSADLILPSVCSKIQYAGLYWSGTYFWRRRYYINQDANGNNIVNFVVSPRPAFFTPDGDFFTDTDTGLPAFGTYRSYGHPEDPVNMNDAVARDLPNPRANNDADDFRFIKFAPPGQPYIDITPSSTVPSTVLYDGFRGTPDNPRNRSVQDVPYVGYADVTSILQGLEATQSMSGTYTVGNVKCFTGLTDGGGTAGGWSLVITYEDPNEPRRYISSFEGYALIRTGSAPITYAYQGFQTIPNGPVNARFGIATLEGDEGFVRDSLKIRGDLQTNFTTLSDPANPPDNFFNASISRNGANVVSRNPASRNTLGFDLDLFQIENNNNSVLANGETGATFRTSTGGQNGQSGDTFATFLNTFAIEVIEPDIRIVKRVQDANGRPIPQGNGVRLGQELFYVLTVENIGNDDAIQTRIFDDIPINTSYLAGTVELPAGVTFAYDAATERLTFDVDNSLVTIDAAPFTIRFKVQVATSCESLRDACSEEIDNRAEAEYTGRLSGIFIPADGSVFDVDECEEEENLASNFIVDLGTCSFDFETSLCNGEAQLTAGNNYDSYTWTNSAGMIIGNTQTIVVTQTGTYNVEGVSNDCRNNRETHRVVPLTTNAQHPVLPFANNIVVCPIDGSLVPEIYLCGDESRTLDVSGFINASTIEWERLQEGSCPASPLQDCPTTDGSCNWVTVGTDPVFTVNEPTQTFDAEGEYRISVVFANTCTEFFYFRVYQNELDASLEKTDIICGDAGSVRVLGVPTTGYEFSIDNSTFQPEPEFTGITTQGEVTVYIRQTAASGNPVLCTFEERITLFEIETEATITITNPSCPEDNGDLSTGSIRIQLASPGNNVVGPYSYSITNGTFTDSATPDANNVIFENLNPGTYTIEATSFDGNCIEMETATIMEPPVFDAVASLRRDLSCERAEILITMDRVTTGSLSFSFDNFTTTIQPGDAANPENNPPNYFQDNTNGTYSVFVNTAGTYTISVRDITTNCVDTALPIIVNPYDPIAFSQVPVAPACSGDSNGSIAVTTTNGSAPFIYVLYDRTVTGATPEDDTLVERATNNTNDPAFTFTGLPAGQYSVSVRDFFGCEFPVRVDLTDPNGLTATASATDYTCDTTSTLTIAASGGTTPYSYSIDGIDFSNTTGSFPNLADGSYTATVRDANNCTFVATPTPVVIDPLQEITDLDLQLGNAACNGTPNTTTVTIDGFVASNGATAAEIEYRIVASNPVTTPTSVTTFSAVTSYPLEQGVTYTFEARTTTDNCVYTEDIFVPEVTPSSVSTQIISDVRCRGEANGAFSFTVVDAANFTYTITGGPTTVPNGSGAGATPITIDTLLAGTYIVTITDTATGCTDDADITINEPAAGVSFTFEQTDATCVAGADITITATGGTAPYRYQIVAGTGPSVATDYANVNPITNVAPLAGGYTIYVVDANGCETSLPLTVDDPVDLTATVAGDFCYQPGKPASLDVTLTNQTDPVSYTVSFNGGAAGAPQNVPSGTNPFNIPNLVPGTYDIVVTDQRGCTVVIPTQTIAPQLTLEAALTEDLDCEAAPANEAVITLTTAGGNGTNVYTYTIDTGSGAAAGSETVTTPTFATTTAGTYIFTVTDAENCTASSQPVIVTPLTEPTATQVVTNLRCFGDDNGTVTITPADGIPPYEFELVTVPTGFTNPGPNNSGTFSSLIPGNYEYVVRDSKSCPSVTIPFEILSPNEITGTFTKRDIVCDDADADGDGVFNELGSITFTNTTGNVAPFATSYTYTLLDLNRNQVAAGATTSANPQGPTTATVATFDDLAFGTYYIGITDSDNCTEEIGPIQIDTAPVFTINATPTLTCLDGVIVDFTVSGGTGPFEVRLNTGQIPGDLSGFIALNGQPTSSATPPIERNHRIDASNLGPLDYGISHFIEVIDTSTNCTFVQEIGPEASPRVDVTAIGSTASCDGFNDGNVEFTVDNYLGSSLDIEILDALTRTTVPNGTLSVTGQSAPFADNIRDVYTAAGATLPDLTAGSYIIRFTETDATLTDPCFGSANFEIIDPDPLLISVSGLQQPLCDADGEVTAIGSGGTAPYTYIAVTRGTLVDPTDPSFASLTFQSDDRLELDPAVSLNWDIYLQDSRGCIAGPEMVDIVAYTEPTLIAAVANECDVNADGTLTITLTATGQTGTTFQYSTNNVGFEPNPATTATTYSFDVLPGLGQIFYVRDGNGCIAESAPIDVFPELILSATPTAPNCNETNGTIVVSSSGGSGVANHTYQVFLASDLTTPLALAFDNATNTFSGVTTESYVVRVTDSGISDATSTPCSEDFPVTIPDAVEPVIAPIATSFVSCIGDEDGQFTAVLETDTDTDTEPPYSYELTSVPAGFTGATGPQPNGSFSGLAVGSYEITVTSSRGCTATQTAVINNPPVLAVSAVLAEDFACAMDNSTSQAQIVATIDAVNGGTPGGPPSQYSFSIDSDTDAVDTSTNFFNSNGAANSLADNQHLFAISPITVTTIYTITARDANGCTTTDTVTVEPLNKPAIDDVVVVTPFSCDDSEEIRIDIVNGSGNYTIDLLPEGTGVPAGQNAAEDVKTVSVPVGTTASVNYTLDVPGITYTFKITDNTTMCFVTISHSIAPLDPINAVLTEGTPIVCIGDSGSINLSVTGFTGAFTYTTNGPTVLGPLNGTAPTAAGTPIEITGLAGGSYTVTISRGINTSTSCNFTTGSIPVRTPDLPLVIMAEQVQDLGCDPTDNGSIQTETTGGYGGYTYQLEDATVPGTAYTNAVGTTYSFGTINFFTDLPAGTYTAVVRDLEGCEERSNDVIINPPTPMDPPVTADMMVNCFMDDDGGTATVVASGGQGVGSYIFTLTFPAPDSQVQAPIRSDTDRIVFEGLVPDNDNPYTGTVTDNLGCSAPFSFFITEPSEVEVMIATSNTLTCQLPETITVSAMGGTPPHEFGISTDGGATITYGPGNSFNIYADDAGGTRLGPGDYTFYARDANGCESNASNQLSIDAIPDVEIVTFEASEEVLCIDESTARVRATVTGGLGNYQYTLTGTEITTGATISYTGTNADDDTNNYRFPGTFINLEGNYNYIYTVTSADCTGDSRPFTVTEPPELIVDITPFDVTCNDPADMPADKDGRIVIIASGGSGEFTYTLEDLTRPASTGNGDSETLPFQTAGPANENPETFEFTMLQTGTYRVTVEDRNGCFVREENVVIGEPEVLTATPIVTMEVECADQNNAIVEVTIAGGTPPYTISENGGTFVAVPMPATPTDPYVFVSENLFGETLYNYDVLDSRGCLATNFVITAVGLSVNASLICETTSGDEIIGYGIQAIIPQNVIDQRPALLTNLEYILDPGTADERVIPRATFEGANNNIFSNVGPGPHVVAVRSASCTFTVTPDVVVPDVLQITAVVPTGELNEWTVIVDGGVPFDTTTGEEPYRIFVDGIQIEGNTFVVDVTRTYTFRVEDSLTTSTSGLCPATTSIELTFVDLFIPNYFTPNGDGTYDTWYPENTEFFPDIKVKIFDRYGRLLEQFKGPVKGWDGRYQDKLLPSGDYWYLIELSEGGRDRQFTGHFTLYR